MLQNFQYDVTILIPIHNAELTLESTINSILFQENFDKMKIEILLINDGSVDNSERVCLEFVNRFNFIKYFSHENKGVSYTRNRGVKEANGRYILFLDADDLLSEDTVWNNMKIFDDFYSQSDILAYPIYNIINDTIKNHPRTNKYKCTELIDVEENPYLLQPTMNVMIKNSPSNKTFFNESLSYVEDNFFNMNMINRKKSIILSDKGKYIYRINSFSAVNKFKSPFHSYQQLLFLFEKVIEEFSLNGTLPKFIQANLLHEINWRINSKSLFPFHLQEKEYLEWKNKFLSIAKYFDYDTILKHPNIDKYHKYYLINLFNQFKKINYFIEDEVISFNENGEELLNIEEFQLVFNDFKIKNNKLILNGFIKEPFLEHLDNLKLLLNINNQTIELELFKSNNGFYKSFEYTNLFLHFIHEIELSGREDISFFVEINNVKLKTNFYFKKNTIMKTLTSKENFVLEKNYFIEVLNNNSIQVNKISNPFSKLISSAKVTKKRLKTKYFLFSPFKYLKKNKEKKINLYCDQPGVLSEGFKLFEHNLEHIKNEEHYYIFRNTDSSYFLSKLEKYQNYLIKFGSLNHKRLFLNANKIFTNSASFNYYSAFGLNAYNLFAEYFDFELIWVRGYSNVGLYTKKYSKEVLFFDKVMVKNEEDKNFLIHHYHFNEKDIIMNKPRNYLLNKEKGEKILISFTWRSYLLENNMKDIEAKRGGRFAHSLYFKNLFSMLTSDKIDKILSNGTKIDFYIHPKFKVYSDLFNYINPRINLIFELDDISPYKLLISDYSSLINCFEYHDKNVLKCHIDKEEFVTGNHLYSQLIHDNDYFDEVDSLLDTLLENYM